MSASGSEAKALVTLTHYADASAIDRGEVDLIPGEQVFRELCDRLRS